MIANVPPCLGILEPVGSANKVFTPPAPLTLEVEISREYSRRRLLRSLSGITYKWKHNDSVNMIQGVRIRNNRIDIPQTNPSHAGSYSVSVTSFGLSNNVDVTCSRIVLEALKNYAIFQNVEFHTESSKYN